MSQGFLPRFKKKDLINFLLDNEDWGNIGIVSGLSRTGKTTLLIQTMLDLPEDILEHAAYFSINDNTIWKSITDILQVLYKEGYTYIFIDEITSCHSYIKSCKDLPNYFSKLLGMKIIISGSNSLSLYLSYYDGLLDKAYLYDTTQITFREWKTLMEYRYSDRKFEIDDYMRYG